MVPAFLLGIVLGFFLGQSLTIRQKWWAVGILLGLTALFILFMWLVMPEISDLPDYELGRMAGESLAFLLTAFVPLFVVMGVVSKSE